MRTRDEDGVIGERQEIRFPVGGFVMLRRRLPVRAVALIKSRSGILAFAFHLGLLLNEVYTA